MNFNINDASTSGGTGFIPKKLQPNNHFCRIDKITIAPPPYNKNALAITMVLVGPKIEGFEGFAKDKMNPHKGNYEGRVAYVQATQFPFSDFTTKSGEVIKKETMIFRWINTFATQMGVIEKAKADNFESETIEEYVFQLSKYLTAEDLWGYFTIAGKERETNAYGTEYNMFFPKGEKTADGKYLLPYIAGEIGTDDSDLKSKMLMFDPNKHIIRKSVPVEDAVEDVSKSESSVTWSPSMSSGSGTVTMIPASSVIGGDKIKFSF